MTQPWHEQGYLNVAEKENALEIARLNIELAKKLTIAITALEFYAKQTGCECSPSYVPTRAIEALAAIGSENDSAPEAQ